MRAITAAGLGALALAVGCSSPPVRPGPLRAGVATVAFEAPVGVSMGAYAREMPSDEPGSPWAKDLPSSRGVHTAPNARALALTNGLDSVVLVRAELGLVTPTLRARAERLLVEGGQTAPLLLLATHTHAGPGRLMPPVLLDGTGGVDVGAQAMDRYSPEIEEVVARGIAAAAAAALADLRRVSVGVASAELPLLNADRRCQNDDLYGPDHRYRTLTVARLDEVDESGAPIRPLTGLLHYALHGTVLAASSTLMSGDAPGALELAAADAVGVPLLFVQGPAGDVSPAADELGHSGLQLLERIGALGATVVARAFEEAAPGPAGPEGALRFTERWLPLSREAIGYARGEFPENGAVGCLLGVRDCVQYTPPQSAICLPLGRRSYSHTSVGLLELEGLSLVTLPGEPTTAVGERVRQRVQEAREGTRALVAGYAQDYLGYLLEAPDFLRGGYEPTVSPWGWRFADYLDQEVGALLSGAAALPRPSGPTLQPAAPLSPVDSEAAPAVTLEPKDLERLQTAVLTFEGGDPALGLPRVSLEQEVGGRFVQAMASPTRAVVGGPELLLRYRAVPSFQAEPQAQRRRHVWTAEWETVQRTPVGRYRLSVSGRTARDGTLSGYALASAPFFVQRSSAPGARASVSPKAGRLELRVRFAPNVPRYERGGDPSANHRLRDALSSPKEGAPARGGHVRAELRSQAGDVRPVTFDFDDGLGAYVAHEAPRAGTLVIPPLGFVDGWGNTNGARLEVPVPATQ